MRVLRSLVFVLALVLILAVSLAVGSLVSSALIYRWAGIEQGFSAWFGAGAPVETVPSLFSMFGLAIVLGLASGVGTLFGGFAIVARAEDRMQRIARNQAWLDQARADDQLWSDVTGSNIWHETVGLGPEPVRGSSPEALASLRARVSFDLPSDRPMSAQMRDYLPD